jgi:hypothetical protein
MNQTPVPIRASSTSACDPLLADSAAPLRGYVADMVGLERFLLPLVLVAVAAYVSPGLAAFCGASLLVIWGLVELVGVCGSRFFRDN